MNLGFIGTGSMGSILIEAFLRSGAVRPTDIIAVNRTKAKAVHLANKYPGLGVADRASQAAAHSDLIFICVKPMEFCQVIPELRPAVTPQHIVISITSPVLIRHLEEQLPCKIAKVIPSITNDQLSGATLCMYSDRMAEADRELLERLLFHISTPIRVEEAYTRVCSDLSSCGPAFLAYFIEQFVQAAVQITGIPEEQATRLASEMVLGTGKLLTSGGFTPQTLQQRGSVPGGITSEGLRLLAEELSGVFPRLIRTTHIKYEDERNKIEAALRRLKTD